MIDGYEDKGFRTVELNGVKTSKRMTSFELELIGEIDRLRSENSRLSGCFKNLLEAFECRMDDWGPRIP